MPASIPRFSRKQDYRRLSTADGRSISHGPASRNVVDPPNSIELPHSRLVCYLSHMRNLSPVAVVALALFGSASLMRAEDPDKDMDAALQQASEAAKKMGMEMPDAKKVMDESAKEEAKEKAAKQAVVNAPGPAELPKWTPKVPQFTPAGPVAKQLIDNEPAVAQKGTSPLTPAELADAWEKAIANQPINHVRNNMSSNGSLTTILFLSTRTDPEEEVRLEARRDPGEKISHVMVLSPLPVPDSDDEDD